MDTEKVRVSREKLTRVFRYLEALNQHRNPAKRQIREQLWSLRLRDLPVHSSILQGEVRTNAAKAKKASEETTRASCPPQTGPFFVIHVLGPPVTEAVGSGEPPASRKEGRRSPAGRQEQSPPQEAGRR